MQIQSGFEDNSGVSSDSSTENQTQPTLSSILKNQALVADLQQRGFVNATALQSQLIPAILSGADVVAIGARASGKSLSYGFALAEKFADKTSGLALVLTCTNDYAAAIKSRLEAVGHKTVLASEWNDSSTAQIVVGTPDTVTEAIARGLPLAKVSCSIWDDIGDLLTPQGQQQAESILSEALAANPKVQLLLLAKTLSSALAAIVKSKFRSPVRVGAEAGWTVEATHNYYEVGGDLMAKPNLLAALINFHADATVAIFCNSPSDADFVEVMLRKRSIESRKLIGNIPSFRLQQSVTELRSGAARAIILTDVSAKSFEVEEIDILVNYSIPSDPEIYIHRLGRAGHGGARGLVISLVGPLDIANFHYLKKFVDFSFSVGEEPPKQSTAAITLKTIEAKAVEASLDDEGKELLGMILSSAAKDSILALLLSNYLKPAPAGRGASNRGDDRRGDNRRGEDRRGRDSDRFEDDRSDSRRGRGRNRRDSHESHGSEFSSSEFGSENDAAASGDEGSDNRSQRGSNRRSRNSRDGHEERNGYERAPRPLPPVRYTRLYVGSGSEAGFSENKLRELVSKGDGLAEVPLKRFLNRNKYSLIDVPEESADRVIDQLKSSSSDDSLLVMRATLINEPRDEQTSEEPSRAEGGQE